MLTLWRAALYVILVSVAFAGLLSSFAELYVNARIHRLISDDWDSLMTAEDAAAQQNRIHQIFLPSVVVFLASIGTGLGTGLMLDEGSTGVTLTGQGSVVVVWSFVLGIMALLVVTALPKRRAWDHTVSYELLLRHVIDRADHLTPSELARAERRLAEVDESQSRDRRRCQSAAALFPQLSADDALNARPQRLVGLPRTEAGERVRLSWCSLVRWSSTHRRGMLMLVGALALVGVVMFATSIGAWLIGDETFVALACASLVIFAGVGAGLLALRLDLFLYARLNARGALARAALVSHIRRDQAPRGNAYTQVFAIGRIGLIELDRAPR